jgi:hypothetical protein
MTMKGGNTDAIYNSGDNRFEFANSLKQNHPELVKIVWRYGRWHHDVNYLPFKKNRLVRKKNLYIPSAVNNYGMFLKERTPRPVADSGEE